MPIHVSVSPSAKRLTTSLRDIGYSFESAVADLIDNSITANATEVRITSQFKGAESTITIVDDGQGMDSESLTEAMRFGTRKTYEGQDLGRYGLGLKTASLSQCRKLEVTSLTPNTGRHQSRCLDLDLIDKIDEWVVLDTSTDLEAQAQRELLFRGFGTVIVWQKLDRLLSAKDPNGAWARRRLDALVDKLENHLSLVFHRFLSGECGRKLKISVNGSYLKPWDPFARTEPGTQKLEESTFQIEKLTPEAGAGTVRLQCFLLPTRDNFTSREAHEAASGPQKWNKQQGIYVYRSNRLVQWGGWAGIRTIDEHTKQARAALDFEADLDECFKINVAKMRVSIPPQLRKMLTRPINELCLAADSAYRRSPKKHTIDQDSNPEPPSEYLSPNSAAIGVALKSAALRTGNMEAFNSISKLIREEMPELADQLGF